MFVISQDRKSVADCGGFFIQKVLGGKKESKFAIVGTPRSEMAVSVSGNLILATFPDEKSAMDTLEKIFAAIDEGETTYRL